MADVGLGAGYLDGDPFAVGRERLWRQLLDGELTEVFQVAGRDFLAWRFGCEPIDVTAYQYNAAGEQISNAEVERIGRELSEQGRWAVHQCGVLWTANSGLLTWEEQPGSNRPRMNLGVLPWDRIFIERAQIALIVLRTSRTESQRRRLHALLRSLRGERTGEGREPGFFAAAEYDRTQLEFYKKLKGYKTPYTPRYGTRPPYELFIAQHLLDKYPEKTLVISSPYEIGQLRTVRIPRRPGDRPADERPAP